MIKISCQLFYHVTNPHHTAISLLLCSGDVAGLSADKVVEMRNLRKLQKKRKASALDASSTSQVEDIDAAFIEVDRPLLSKLRADEVPAHTRVTILSKSGSVCGTLLCTSPAHNCIYLLMLFYYNPSFGFCKSMYCISGLCFCPEIV
jgi:hypothetical protein